MYRLEFSDWHYILCYKSYEQGRFESIAEIYEKDNAEYILSLLQPIYNENWSEISKMY